MIYLIAYLATSAVATALVLRAGYVFGAHRSDHWTGGVNGCPRSKLRRDGFDDEMAATLHSHRKAQGARRNHG